MAEIAAKRLLCCGFQCTGKVMGQVYQWWRICREVNVFSRFEYHVLHFIFSCNLFTGFLILNSAWTR
jgi:hypothetical protein